LLIFSLIKIIKHKSVTLILFLLIFSSCVKQQPQSTDSIKTSSHLPPNSDKTINLTKEEKVLSEKENLEKVTEFEEDEEEEKSKDGDGEDESERNEGDDDWMEVKTKRNKRKNRPTNLNGGGGSGGRQQQTNNNLGTNSEQLDFKFDSELDNGGVKEVEKEVDDLDDNLCNKLIIVTQTPPQYKTRIKMSNKEIEHILKKVEEDLWANKAKNVCFFNFFLCRSISILPMESGSVSLLVYSIQS